MIKVAPCTDPPPVDISGVSPQTAVRDWLGSYRALMRAALDTSPLERLTLRIEYRRCKAVFAAVLLSLPGQIYTGPEGRFTVAVDDMGSEVYPVPLSLPLAAAG